MNVVLTDLKSPKNWAFLSTLRMNSLIAVLANYHTGHCALNGNLKRKMVFRGAPLVAYPQAEGYTRIVEYKKMPPQEVNGTSYALEYPLPYKPGEEVDPYYPVLTEASQKLYSQYKELASKYSNLIPCGRLADFKYYNMDQCLARALSVIASSTW